MLYNATLDTFPGSAILVCALIILLSAALNFVVYTQKWRIELFTSLNGTGEKDIFGTPAVIEQKLDKNFESEWASSSL